LTDFVRVSLLSSEAQKLSYRPTSLLMVVGETSFADFLPCLMISFFRSIVSIGDYIVIGYLRDRS
jgi:hypothetical protein